MLSSGESYGDDEKRLHLNLEEHQLLAIHKAFLEEESGQVDQKQLQALLYDIARLRFNSKEFETMFLKMNTKRYILKELT